MSANRRSIQLLIIGIALIGFLWMDFLPQQGPPHFRYTGSDPERLVLNLGYPITTFIYDPAVKPSLIPGPGTWLLLPMQFCILLLVAFASPLFRFWKRAISKFKQRGLAMTLAIEAGKSRK